LAILPHFAALPVIDLSTQPMGDHCTTKGATRMPIHRLRPGGVVVVWTTLTSLPLGAPHAPKGVRLRIARPGYCRTIGGAVSEARSTAYSSSVQTRSGTA
jgi:hypothetical protein